MPKKSKTSPELEAPFTIEPEILEALVPGPMSPASFNELFRQLKKALLERALNMESAGRRGCPEGGISPEGKAHRRTDACAMFPIGGDPSGPDVPQDGAGACGPRIVGQHERRITGFDGKIVSMYARGMTVREIQRHLLEFYAVEISPQFVRELTGAIEAEATEWRHRPLESLYPVVFFDGLRVKIQEGGLVHKKTVYWALGVLPDGTRDILGLWIAESEGAGFWLQVFNDLRNRGVADILIVIVDNLKGFPEAVNAAFPATIGQTCVVHLIRTSLGFVNWKDRKAVTAALRPVYAAPAEAAARNALAAFAESAWGQKYPSIAIAWQRAWDHIIPSFVLPPEIRHAIYAATITERLHKRLRKIIRTRGHFPKDEDAIQLLWLALRDITSPWRQAARVWKGVMNRLAVLYPDRFASTLR
jgi:putative transposase